MSRFRLPADQDEHPVDPDALRAFAAGAKEHRVSAEPPPWEGHDPKALPRYNVSVRLNDYHIEMLRFLAQHADVSQQKVLNRILVPAIEQQVKDITEG